MNLYLQFSDAAKYAEIARSLVGGHGYNTNFSFFIGNLFTTQWIPPFTPFSMAAFFKVFGVGDFAVIATSFLYFILTLIFVFLLAKKIFLPAGRQVGKLVGILSTLAVGFNYDIIHYATNGASESPFIFEIVAASYFASIKKKWASVVTVLFLILMYFTRPQAFIYIAGIVLYWLLINFKFKKALIYFGAISVVGFLVDYFVLMPLSGKYFLYSIIGRGIGSSFSQTSVASDVLRGATGVVEGGITQTLKNIFYNLYNFYKALPEIINPYFFALFAVGIFLPPSRKATEGQENPQRAFKWASLFMVIVTFVVTAASIPFYRYLHPIIPLVYILATGTLVRILDLGFRNYDLRISRQLFINLTSIFIILFFGVGQTIGKFVLDSRFEAKTHNVGKPPVYVEISKVLKENTKSTDVIVTNLDTWGSWYGERKTVWFPLEPKQIIDPATGEIPFDAIYLTSYLIDDPNYYMGEGWRMIFENPEDSSKWECDGCSEISKEFTLKGVYGINATDNYERQGASAILLIKK